ncbi:MAG: 50S ribosomal protein L23 [Bacteroidetes bacterium]|nr:MAG: 50S ribosomal protein L23 [Bacteroidota bacterium]GIV57411.1 MAG: 50S ribosomal protein L23 [Rhodothermaceae bacterium]
MSQDILIRPLVTEKMTALMEAGHYAFVVRKDANKIQIRRAVEARYPGVKIKEVRTMIVRGKRRRQFTRRGPVEGRQAAYKKAIVTLMPDSEAIDFFEQV